MFGDDERETLKSPSALLTLMAKPSGKHTKEPQYDIQVETDKERGPVRLGLMTSHVWRSDPRRLGFLLARYKFVAKMLAGRKDAVEIGCGDAFGAEVVQQEVPAVHCVDFDPVFIENARKLRERKGLTFEVADLTARAISPPRAAAYSLDVLEHIPQEREDAFLTNIATSLAPDGVCIIGMPSLESQAWASEWSKEGHVNCKSGPDFKRVMERHFQHVFLFSMNDEVVHTGFAPMAHYLLAIGVNPKP